MFTQTIWYNWASNKSLPNFYQPIICPLIELVQINPQKITWQMQSLSGGVHLAAFQNNSPTTTYSILEGCLQKNQSQTHVYRVSFSILLQQWGIIRPPMPYIKPTPSIKLIKTSWAHFEDLCEVCIGVETRRFGFITSIPEETQPDCSIQEASFYNEPCVHLGVSFENPSCFWLMQWELRCLQTVKCSCTTFLDWSRFIHNGSKQQNVPKFKNPCSAVCTEPLRMLGFDRSRSNPGAILVFFFILDGRLP